MWMRVRIERFLGDGFGNASSECAFLKLRGPVMQYPTITEVENCLKKKKAELLRFRSDQVLARVEKLGDLFEPVEKLKQKLPKKWNA